MEKIDNILASKAEDYKKYKDLVEALKNSLVLGQLGFLKAAKILTLIKEKKLYKLEDSQTEWTWADFTSRPDLPIPGSTPQSRRRTADSLIRIYKIFVEKFGCSTQNLAEIGWTKLNLIASVCEGGQQKEVQEWLSKAEHLTVNDLYSEIKGVNRNPDCAHENVYQIWVCAECGARSKFGWGPNLPAGS